MANFTEFTARLLVHAGRQQGVSSIRPASLGPIPTTILTHRVCSGIARGHRAKVRGGGYANTMDSSAHERVTPAERVGIVTSGCCADMLVNYPLWIVAKRVSAGLGPPAIHELYKGSTSLLVAFGPMILVQDSSTAFMLRRFEGCLESPTLAHASSAAIAGAVGALTVGSQIEGVITRAHATKQTVLQATRSIYETRGLAALLAPYGMTAMVGREVPYAGCLFFLSGYIRSRVTQAWPTGASHNGSEPPEGQAQAPISPGSMLRDMLSAAMTAAVAGPLSQAPSVVAAHQQAHQVSLLTACREISAAGGLRSFFGGLAPRTTSLAGSLFIFPFTVEAAQGLVERWRS